MVTGKAGLAGWLEVAAVVEFAGPVEQAVRASATAAATAAARAVREREQTAEGTGLLR
jgi:hypothetical protein